MQNLTFGEKLKNLRIAKNLKQSELGAKIGCSQQAIARWEKQSTIPSRRNIILLCDALNIRVSDFFNGVSLTEPEIKEVERAALSQKETEREEVANIGWNFGMRIVEKQKKDYFAHAIPLYKRYKTMISEEEKLLEKIATVDNTATDDILTMLEKSKEELNGIIESMLGTELLFLDSAAYPKLQEFFDELLSNPDYTTDEYKELLKQSEESTED